MSLFDGDHPLDGRIETQEQATKLVEMYASKAETARLLCNVKIPDDPKATADAQQKAYQQWLMNYGSAVGALVSLHKAGKISDNAYVKLQQRVFLTLRPTVVGEVSGRKPLIVRGQ